MKLGGQSVECEGHKKERRLDEPVQRRLSEKHNFKAQCVCLNS